MGELIKKGIIVKSIEMGKSKQDKPFQKVTDMEGNHWANWGSQMGINLAYQITIDPDDKYHNIKSFIAGADALPNAPVSAPVTQQRPVEVPVRENPREQSIETQVAFKGLIELRASGITLTEKENTIFQKALDWANKALEKGING